MIRVPLVDGRVLIRAGCRALPRAEDCIKVVAEAGDGRQAIELAVRHVPDVALIDVQMPVLDDIEATRHIAADHRDALLSPAMVQRLIGEFVSRTLNAGSQELNILTNREREVVALAAQGLSNDEIAARMIISPATAKTHIGRATKLAAGDRAQLVVFAWETGPVSARSPWPARPSPNSGQIPPGGR